MNLRSQGNGVQVDGVRGFGRRAAFSMVEIMVVVTILLLAFSIMVPALAGFFTNRELEKVAGEINSAISTARMQAVVNRRPFSVVFFQEGVRVYDVKNRSWMADDDFDPKTAPAASPRIHFDLFFAGKHSDGLPAYEEWEIDAPRPAATRRGSRANPDSGFDQVSVEGLIAIVFGRDGTLSMIAAGGSDVPSGKYRMDPPRGADIVVWQDGNDNAAFIDLQSTGSIKFKIAPSTEVKSLRKDPGV